jgi:hypothetical protein
MQKIDSLMCKTMGLAHKPRPRTTPHHPTQMTCSIVQSVSLRATNMLSLIVENVYNLLFKYGENDDECIEYQDIYDGMMPNGSLKFFRADTQVYLYFDNNDLRSLTITPV